ncbi:anti-sigma factor family protein [Desulfoluna butyratoxydans]|uniref:Putative zinc-finger n=1 Tax=Desulfoluna butyratoxydans TaxID=231438 RepID=A0A4U8YGL7_9BACT|nr:zf-HC2 domain-containing protein [Desulfoluna butyratoxydans]VFQ42526.1 putative zinc-finger [Desulfoluna butyratoxydans]
MEHPLDETLHAYVDNALDRQGEKAVEAHLSRCPSCRREVDELALLFDDLKGLPSPPPDRKMVTRILLARRREEASRPVTFNLIGALFGRIGWAAVAVGLMAGGLLGYASLTTRGLDRPTQEAAHTLAQEDPFLGYLISDNGDVL